MSNSRQTLCQVIEEAEEIHSASVAMRLVRLGRKGRIDTFEEAKAIFESIAERFAPFTTTESWEQLKLWIFKINNHLLDTPSFSMHPDTMDDGTETESLLLSLHNGNVLVEIHKHVFSNTEEHAVIEDDTSEVLLQEHPTAMQRQQLAGTTTGPRPEISMLYPHFNEENFVSFRPMVWYEYGQTLSFVDGVCFVDSDVGQFAGHFGVCLGTPELSRRLHAKQLIQSAEEECYCIGTYMLLSGQDMEGYQSYAARFFKAGSMSHLTPHGRRTLSLILTESLPDWADRPMEEKRILHSEAWRKATIDLRELS